MRTETIGVLRTACIATAFLLFSTSICGQTVDVDVVETTDAVLSFNKTSGDLVGVRWKRPQLEIVGEAKLGENFRVLLPRSDYEANYFNSLEQIVRRVEKQADRIVLHYGPLKNAREEVDVDVSYEIQDQNGQLRFSIQVDNRTGRPLAEVFYGILGGQQGIGNRLETESVIPAIFAGNQAPKLFSQYKPKGLGFATPFDYAGYAYPGDMAMGWMDIYNPKAGVGYYYANQDPEIRIAALYTEMHPYSRQTYLEQGDTWPRRDELPPGEPIGLTMGWVNFPYTRRGTFRAGPIALQVHEGDWRSAARVYRQWYDQNFALPSAPNWLRKEMAWFSVLLLSPDDEILFRFRDLPRLAAEAKRYGVTTFQIFGWNVGGDKREHPNYSPDPRLGTAEEFRKALADMRAIGVHPLLGVGLNVADSSTEEFRSHLYRYAVHGRWGPDAKTIFAFGQSTIGGRVVTGTYGFANGQLESLVARPLVELSPSHAEFREQLVRQYVDRIRDGAEGLQQDGVGFWDLDLDFNPRLRVSPDRSLPEGVLATHSEFLSRARKVNPDAALSLMDSFDRTFPYSSVAYAGMGGKDAPLDAVRYTFPEWNIATMIENPSAFAQASDALRYGVVWGMAPLHHTASMEEPLTQPLSRYVAELIRIRKQYSDLLFFGRFNDTSGAEVSGSKDNIRYSVFTTTDQSSTQRACVVVNYGDSAEPVEVSIPGSHENRTVISMPFQPDRTATLPVRLVVPPQTAAVLVVRNSREKMN